MTADLDNARALLASSGCTCVLCKEKQIYTSTQRGVAPLLAWLDGGTDLQGFSAADKVVGKAAAFLYCLLGVRAVYAPVMSKAALQVFTDHGIAASCDELSEGIINRRKDGPCPMESATKDIHDPEAALRAVRKLLQTMAQNH